MKKLVFALATLLAASPATAQLGVSVAADGVTDYAWRGLNILRGGAFQPSLTISEARSGLSLGAWSSFAAVGRDRPVVAGGTMRSDLDELDLTASITRPFGAVSLTGGLIHYAWFNADGYPDTDGTHTNELFLGAGFGNLPLAPSLTVFYDFDGDEYGDGYYALLSGARSFNFGKTVDIGASLGYMDQSWRPEEGISDVNVGAGVPFAIGKLTFTPSVTYTFAPGFDGVDDDHLVWAKASVKWAN